MNQEWNPDLIHCAQHQLTPEYLSGIESESRKTDTVTPREDTNCEASSHLTEVAATTHREPEASFGGVLWSPSSDPPVWTRVDPTKHKHPSNQAS